MPLPGGYGKKAIGQAIGIEMKHGKPQKQAVAIAFSNARRNAKKAGARVGYLAREKTPSGAY